MNFINFNYRRDILMNDNIDVAIGILENHDIRISKEDFKKKEKNINSEPAKSTEIATLPISNMNRKEIKKSIKINSEKLSENSSKVICNSTPVKKKNTMLNFQTRNTTKILQEKINKEVKQQNETRTSSKPKTYNLISKINNTKTISSNNVILNLQSSINNNKSSSMNSKNINQSKYTLYHNFPISSKNNCNNKISLNLETLDSFNKSNENFYKTTSSSNLHTPELMKVKKSSRLNYTKEIQKIYKSKLVSKNVY